MISGHTKNVVIINFNTQDLTDACIKSLNKHTPGTNVFVFDNSTKTPFVNTFDNVSVIDNTQGQIVDFANFGKLFKLNPNSGAKLNNYGSAKHAYSIQKCCELIEDGFVLLDSDVIIKRDISNLFDFSKLYVAETYTQTNSIKRVLPYICFINTKMMKDNGLSYFHKDYIHGLLSKSGDSYDTGGYLYLLGKKFPHTDIKTNIYITHFAGGSWETEKSKKLKRNSTSKDFISRFKHFTQSNKRVIYTVITGGYDQLKQPRNITPNTDYIVFTDNVNIDGGVWEVRPLPIEVNDLSNVKKQRYIKINAHKVLSDYEDSIYVDGAIEILDDLSNWVSSITKDEVSVYIPTHPVRRCIYQEAIACLLLKKDTQESINKTIKFLKDQKFPENQGLVQSNIIYRRHNDQYSVKLMDLWWEVLETYSHRDQLSFNYALWKTGNNGFSYLDKNTCASRFFKWWSIHRTNATNQPFKHKTIMHNKQGHASSFYASV